MRRKHQRRDIYRQRKSWEESHQLFQFRLGTLVDQGIRLGVSVPGLGNMTIGGQQPLRHHESGSGNAGPQGGPFSRHRHPVDAEDVTD